MIRVRNRVLAMLLALLAPLGGCDDLAVEPPISDLAELDIRITCRNEVADPGLPGGSKCVLMVGELDTLRLTLLVDSVPATGLRLTWQSPDTTALLIRDGFDFVDSTTFESLTPEQRLSLSEQAQVIARSRGTYEVDFFIDSIGLETASYEDFFFVEVQERWEWVAAGGHHTCALNYTDFASAYAAFNTSIRPGGQAFCWGDGLDGALGTGGFNELQPLDVLTDERFDGIDAGAGHTCATNLKGFVYCWGGNEWGELGTSNTLDQFAPRPLALGIPFQAPSLGEMFSCGVPVSEGTEGAIISATCWGRNVEGQLGCDDGDPESPCFDQGPGDKGNLVVPSEDVVSAAGDIFFDQVTAGSRHACGIESSLISSPTAWCWGDNSFGQLGVSSAPDCVGDDPTDTFPCSRLAVQVQGPGGGPLLLFQKLSAGGEFTCGLTGFEQGEIHCWGRNDQGQLGDGTQADSDIPVRVIDDMVPGGFSDISAGGSHACALDFEGAAFCWGENSDGQLGDGTTMSSSRPVAVVGGLSFESISAGAKHTCGVVRMPVMAPGGTEGGAVPVAFGGAIYCWGDNDPGGGNDADDQLIGGKLGNGTTVDSPIPVRILEPLF